MRSSFALNGRTCCHRPIRVQHVRVHAEMLLWGIRQRSAREVLGQAVRIIGAATKTFVGLVPHGNTGGANVSAFRRMPIAPDCSV